MSLIVSDTTPLNYLILIGQVEILPHLFGKLLVPPAVVRELSHPRTPPAVSGWVNDLPPWVEVRAPAVELRLEIGSGEDEAISLAVELPDAALLVDDRKAREAAQTRGIPIFGTIAVLDLADELGLLDFQLAITQLKATTFRMDKALIEEVLRKVRARKSGQA